MVMPAVHAPTAVGASGWLCGEESSCGGAPAALQCAVDRRAADPEQVGDLGCAVLPGGDQADQMSFLPCVELGPAAAQAALGLRDPHPLLGPQPDEVGLELRETSRRTAATTRHGSVAIRVRWLRKPSASQRIIIQSEPPDTTSSTAAVRAR